MLVNRGAKIDDSPARRERLEAEYGRQLLQTAKLLEKRPLTQILRLHRNAILGDPQDAATRLNAFLGGSLDVVAMADEVQPSLHRQRA